MYNFGRRFLFFLLVTATLLSGCALWSSKNNDVNGQPTGPVRNPELERAYEQQLKIVLAPYFSQQDVAGIKDQILVLRAPGIYLDLHFSLVVAFELLEQGRAEADQSKIEEGLSRLQTVIAANPWLEQ